jgi:hypothetical protein
MCLILKYERYILITIIAAFCTSYNGVNVCVGFSLYIHSGIRGIYDVKMVLLALKYFHRSHNCYKNVTRRNGDKIDTHTLLFTFLTGFRQNQDGYQMVIQLLCLVH